MKLSALIAVLTVVGSTWATTAALAQDADAAIRARKGLMQLNAFHLGQLFAIAKEEVPYDADQASAIANSLLAVASVDQSAMWPQGSDAEAMPGKTTAKAELWTTFPAVMEQSNAYNAAVQALADAAGTDLAALQGALNGVAATCGGCHKPYRVSNN